MFIKLTARHGETYRLNMAHVAQYEDSEITLPDGTKHNGTLLEMRAVGSDGEGRPVPSEFCYAMETPRQIDRALGTRQPVAESDYEAAAAAGYLAYGDEY